MPTHAHVTATAIDKLWLGNCAALHLSVPCYKWRDSYHRIAFSGDCAGVAYAEQISSDALLSRIAQLLVHCACLPADAAAMCGSRHSRVICNSKEC